MQPDNDHEQECFEALDIQTAACSSLGEVNKSMFALISFNNNNVVAIDANCSADARMLEHDEPESILGSSMSWTPTISPNDTAVNIFSEEPIRLLPLGPAPKPKRFFRTFWRGLATRAVALKDRNHSKSV